MTSTVSRVPGDSRLDTSRDPRPAALDAPLVALGDRSDEELARHARDGSLSSFGELVNRYERRLVGFLAQRAGSREAAEDLAQDAFVRAWQKLASYDADRRFSTWLFTIAVRLTTDHHRRRQREGVALEAAANAAAQRGDGRATPEGAEEGREDIWSVARRELTPDQMEVTWLRYVMELPIADIASALGRSRVGTRVLLFRARERLAAALGDEWNGASEAERRRDVAPAPEMGL